MPRDESLRDIRLRKLGRLSERGFSVWPARTSRSHRIRDFHADFQKLSAEKIECTLAGRVRLMREHGGSTFVQLDDGTGRAQAYLKKDSLGTDAYELFLDTADVGDFIEATGRAFTTQRGEETLEALRWQFLGKASRPLPEKWHGLQDEEERLRKRYIDVLTNEATAERFVKRAEFIRNIRAFLDEAGFLEVENPLLEHVPSGADAEPYKTHMSALDLNLYLRISLELPLKKLIVAGYEAVYEIGRVFRNEGMDQEHLAEGFTMLEFYVAYRDYTWLMDFTERLYATVMEKTFGTRSVTHRDRGGNEVTLDFTPPWPRLEYEAIFLEKTGIDLKKTKTKAELEEALRAHGFGEEIEPEIAKPRLIDKIYKHHVRRSIVEPTFLIHHPFEMSPLAKRRPDNPETVERFQVLAAGAEIANAYSELNDPVEQRRRMLEHGGGIDESFIEALEYGMPPTAGFGVGIDRLFMVMAGIENIRETILFPLMRPKQ